MNLTNKINQGLVTRGFLWVTILLFLTGCFTGIESTPKITSNDVKRSENPEREEDKFLNDITAEPFSVWKGGKEFYVTDDKIAIIFGNTASNVGSLKGSYLRYNSAKDVTDITGEQMAELSFISENGETLRYRTDKSLSDLNSMTDLAIPFTIEKKIVDEVRDRVLGKNYYILTSTWFDGKDQSLTGKKFIPVKILDISEGNTVYPVRLKLESNSGEMFYVFMSIGSDQKSSRRFGSLFSFSDPHIRYPHISKEVWDNIINGKISENMTREECRLSLGTPSNVSRNAGYDYMHEIWSYENGVYLVFQDGLLKSYRK